MFNLCQTMHKYTDLRPGYFFSSSLKPESASPDSDSDPNDFRKVLKQVRHLCFTRTQTPTIFKWSRKTSSTFVLCSVPTQCEWTAKSEQTLSAHSHSYSYSDSNSDYFQMLLKNKFDICVLPWTFYIIQARVHAGFIFISSGFVSKYWTEINQYSI